jgi:hypothetical protein
LFEFSTRKELDYVASRVSGFAFKTINSWQWITRTADLGYPLESYDVSMI